MKLLYDASTTLLPLAGIGRYTLELLKALLQAWPAREEAPTVWMNSLRNSPGERHEFLKRAELYGRAHIALTRMPGPVLLESWKRIGMPRAESLAGSKADVLHCPATYIAPSKAPRVVTVHDLHYLRHRDHADKLGGEYFTQVLPRQLPRVEAIIVPSDAVREEMATHFPHVDQEKVHVIPEGVDHDRFVRPPEDRIRSFRALRGIERPYLLFVGTLEPRKNLARLFEAVSVWSREVPAERRPLLVGAGRPGWGDITVAKLLQSSRLDPAQVRWFEDIADDELPALYAGARLTIVPSLWEGFGLTALEAMACECPVIVSRRGAMPEVVGSCATIIDPLEVNHLAIILAHLWETPEAMLREQGKAAAEQARKFTWSAAADRTFAIYERVAAQRR